MNIVSSFTKSSVAYGLANHNFCRYGLSWEVHYDQNRNFEFRLMQEVFQHQRVSKMRTIPSHRNRTAWSIPTSHWSRSTYEKSLHQKLANDRMKTRYDRLANSAGYQEGNDVCFYRPLPHTKWKSPKCQSPREGPY
jgi:hypothetical protein